MIKSAAISPCRRYRYSLTRPTAGDRPGYVCWILINPSTADEVDNDPTVRRVAGFTESWGFSGFEIVNLFAYRTKDVGHIRAMTLGAGHFREIAIDRVSPVGLDNLAHIVAAAAGAELVVAGWGAKVWAAGQARRVAVVLGDLGIRLHALTVSRDGYPGHPLYLKASLMPRPYEVIPKYWARQKSFGRFTDESRG